MDFIYEAAKNAKQEDYVKIQNRYYSIIAEQSEYLKNFIDSNLESKSCILALFKQLKEKTFFI